MSVTTENHVSANVYLGINGFLLYFHQSSMFDVAFMSRTSTCMS